MIDFIETFGTLHARLTSPACLVSKVSTPAADLVSIAGVQERESGAVHGILSDALTFFPRILSPQESASRLLANAGNILQRMPVGASLVQCLLEITSIPKAAGYVQALESAESYSELYRGSELQSLLLAKQLKSLEMVFGRLQAVM